MQTRNSDSIPHIEKVFLLPSLLPRVQPCPRILPGVGRRWTRRWWWNLPSTSAGCRRRTELLLLLLLLLRISTSVLSGLRLHLCCWLPVAFECVAMHRLLGLARLCCIEKLLLRWWRYGCVG
jgi:hypothetical protein